MDKFYTGYTQASIESRLEKHNQKEYGNHYTSQTSDWEVFHVIECSSVSQAVKIEKHIKSMKSSTFIKNLKKYPELTNKLKERFG